MAKNRSKTAQGGTQKTPWLVITLIVLLFLLATGAAIGGTWLYLTSMGFHGPVSAASQPESTTKPVYVSVEPFTVNLDNSHGQVLYTAVSLKVADQKTADNLKAHMPQVRNRILMVLTLQNAKSITTAKGKQALAQGIRKAVSQPFDGGSGKVGIDAVLFTDFIVQ